MATRDELVQKGLAEARQGNYESAAGYFTQALEIEELDTNGHFYLAGVNFKRGELREARKSVNRALDVDPTNDKALDLLRRIEEVLDDDEDYESEGDSSGTARAMGWVCFVSVIIGILAGYGAIFYFMEPLKEGYGKMLGMIYCSLDVEDPITESWQFGRWVTAFFVAFAVLSSYVVPGVALSFALSCPLYAIRHGEWTVEPARLKELGTAEAMTVLLWYLPLAVWLSWVVTLLWGAKFLVFVAIAVLLLGNQCYEMHNEEKKKRRR
jgi:tetratricopeptide (TPR) repeat protein